jgi:pyruvate-formate lyase-activating enzyme
MSESFQPGYKIFPVKSETACLLKWSWSTVNIQRKTTASCHRTAADPLTVDNFKNFHNIPEKVLAREKMKNGQWPGRGCEYCENIERIGHVSDRIMTLQRYHSPDKIPPELQIDPAATEVTPIILEVYFNNTCNLSCVYCQPNLSSKINDEIRKFGPIKINQFAQNYFEDNSHEYESMVKQLWEYLTENERYKVIRHFHILGGEPLLQKELEECLTFWEQHPNPSLTINLITNLMLPHDMFVKKMQRIEKLVSSNAIFTVAITASIDCWGKEQQYVRHGIDLDLFEKNFEYLLNKPWVNLSIHSCLTSLTIKTLPLLLEKINCWNSKISTPIDYSYDIVIGQLWKKNAMHPVAFGPGVFDSDFEKIMQLLPENTHQQKTTKNQMMGIRSLIQHSHKNSEKISDLKLYLTELDKRRGTDWKSVFEWLDNVN